MQTGSIVVFSFVNFAWGDHHSLSFSFEESAVVILMHHDNEEGNTHDGEHHEFHASQSEQIGTHLTKLLIKSPLAYTVETSRGSEISLARNFLLCSLQRSLPKTLPRLADNSVLLI